jgi:hypothetical protein
VGEGRGPSGGAGNAAFTAGQQQSRAWGYWGLLAPQNSSLTQQNLALKQLNLALTQQTLARKQQTLALKQA